MASILTPPEPLPSPSSEESQTALWEATQGGELDLTPHQLLQLEDDLERSRMREAFWISVVVHLMVVILLALSPKIFPMMRGGVVATPEDMMRNQQATFLDLPPDMQKAPKVAPKTDVLSDKNRIAMSRHPSIDKRTLEELKRAGPPKMQAPPAQQARRAVASRRGGASYGGDGGSYGAGPGGSALKMGPLEVLSDTQGVDFGPYLERVVQAVSMNWYAIIPQESRPPLLKKGKVAIQFAIMPHGKVVGMQIYSPSGDTPLDRAAWGGITASAPFAPLPSQFHGPYLALRFRF